MTTIKQPSWMAGYKPKRGNPNWASGMKSPNPNGRPAGIVDKRTKVSQALMDDAPAITRVVIDAALEGDMQAASLILARVAPTIKAKSDTVQFTLDSSATLSAQAQQIMQAISESRVDPDTGRMLIDCLGSLAAMRQIDELAARITQLEKSTHGVRI